MKKVKISEEEGDEERCSFEVYYLGNHHDFYSKTKKTIISSVANGGTCGTSKRLKKPMYASMNEGVITWIKSATNHKLGLINEKTLEINLHLIKSTFKSI